MKSVCTKTWTLSTRARFVTKTHTAIVRTTETTATICNCHYNCCLHSCTDGRYSLELYLNCTQQTNQNYFAAAFFIIIIYFARQNTETSSPLNVYSATVFGLCTALSRLMGRKYGMYEVYGTHGCLFSIHIRWMRMEGCFCVTVYVVGCCCGGCFFSCFSWKYRFCVQAKTHLKLFVPPTKKQAFHFWQRSFSGCSYPCSLYPMTLCVTLRRRGSMIFSSVTFVWMEIRSMCSMTCALLQHSSITSSTDFQMQL